MSLSKRQIVSLEKARAAKALKRLKPAHPGDLIKAMMEARGWRVADLAGQMTGDLLRNRVLLSHYLTHPIGTLLLGGITASRIAAAFGISPDILLDLEKAWLTFGKEAA